LAVVSSVAKHAIAVTTNAMPVSTDGRAGLELTGYDQPTVPTRA
jgi:hypothetical protein